MKTISVAAMLLGACALVYAKHAPSSRTVASVEQTPSKSNLRAAKRAVRNRKLPRQHPRVAALWPVAHDPTSLGPEIETLRDPEAEPSACIERLREFARFIAQPDKDGPGACDIGDAVQLERIVMPDGSTVALTPPATLACGMAEAVTHWMRNEVAPAAAGLDAPPAALVNLSSYACRGRNNIRGAKLSEHGRGNALDVGAIRLANGEQIALNDRAAPTMFRQYVRAAACERFSTVLGPGSDRFHESHIHLDLAAHKGGRRLCQWDVREATAGDESVEPWPRTVAPRKRGSRS